MSTARAQGGVPARRAVVRWAWRLFRRDWRQHALILALLSLAVAAAVGLSTAAFNVAPVSGQAEFGDANHWFRFNDPDPKTLPAKLDAAREWFGQIDAIGHRPVPLPGTVKEIDYRSQTPDGPFGKPLLRLRSGRYPSAETDVAITDDVARSLGLGIGSTLDLDGLARTVVGTVENPSDLGDEFALLPASAIGESTFVTMLVDASDARVSTFRPPGDRGRIVGSREAVPADVLAAVLTLVVTTLALFLVALIAAASFTVVAQRRLPQLGMMAAIGASEKQLRLAMLATGAATGAIAAVAGALVGLAGWLALAPRVGDAVGYRIDALNVPWWLVVIAMLLAIGAATAAAWWPARTVSRISPMAALSGRPPAPRALHRSTALAIGLLVGGAACLVLSNANAPATTMALVLIAVGMIGVVAGVLLVSPLAIQAIAGLAARVPVAGRLALRDLSRYRARSGAALAAIALALGMAATIVAAAGAATNNIGLGNLSTSQLLLHGSEADLLTLPDAPTIDSLQEGADEIGAALPDATVIRLDVATDPNARLDPRTPDHTAVALGRRASGQSFEFVDVVYVASPALLALYGLDSGDLAGTDIVTTETGSLQLLWTGGPRPAGADPGEPFQAKGDLPKSYSSLPGALVTEAGLAARGWQATPSGTWLVQTPKPLTADELNTARVIATQSGLRIESREDHARLVKMSAGAVAIGMLLALAILGMTVGLIRSESAGELRTLTATGATRATRRAITAFTSGALAALGALLGIAGAYIALAAGQLSHLTPLPVAQLAVIVIGTPLVAVAAGWVFAGREPAVIARRALD